MNKGQSNDKVLREQARQILKDGILDMSVSRIIQMSQLGLKGNIVLSNEIACIKNAFNCISYDEESNVITFSVKESQSNSYGAISFSVNAITEISGCEDKEYPEEYLNVNIKLKDGITVGIRILY